MKHVMIDLETLSSENDAAIIQIGACEFDIKTGQVPTSFRINVEPEVGRIDPSTVFWWMQQDENARKSVTAPPQFSLAASLDSFSGWFPKGAPIWSHATFDVPILGKAYRLVGKKIPWSYRAARDIRTLQWLAKDLGADLKQFNTFEGIVKHDAMEDAIAQAKYVSQLYNYIKEGQYDL